MKRAADFRQIAREALQGRWTIAILTGFIASLLGAGIATSASSTSSSSELSTTFQEFQGTELFIKLQPVFGLALVVFGIWAIVCIVISGAAKLGYASFNLKLVDRRDVALSDLFSQFNRLGAGFFMNLLLGLYTFLWTLLFVIPGIIKEYSYAMTPYILAENPSWTANEAITESRHLMDGNKWRLFCLEISFIGWVLLCGLPGIVGVVVLGSMAIASGNLATAFLILPCLIPSFLGNLFLRPYREAARAAFYRELAGNCYVDVENIVG